MASSLAYTKTGSVLAAKNLNLYLEGNHILRDINLDIQDLERPGCITGQIEAILAPSGTGKTQLLKCLCGYYNPEENNDPNGFAYMTGQVLIGKDQHPAQLGKVGYVQQNYKLWNHLTVYNNQLLAAHRLPKGERKDKVEAYLNHFDLWDKKDLFPNQLSGGQKQRVAIAQAFINAEGVVLMDEPFSGLDAIMISKVSELIVKTANLREENTIVIVSHDISNTLIIADTVYMMGKNHNPDGSLIPGATIKFVYDMVDLDLAWHENLRKDPRFNELVLEVRDTYKELI